MSSILIRSTASAPPDGGAFAFPGPAAGSRPPWFRTLDAVSPTPAPSEMSQATPPREVVELAAAPTDGDRLLNTLDTPAMRQFRRFKEAHPGCLLFFRMGDFYELFGEDAVRAHKALGITLTERTAGVPMAGVPHHAAEQYLRRLVEQGFRVAVADQMQDPKDAKGVVDRAVTRVVTPGTLVDEHLLEDARANRVAAVAAPAAKSRDPRWAIASIEISTGSFRIEWSDESSIRDRLARLAPQELLIPVDRHGAWPEWAWLGVSGDGVLPCPPTGRPSWTFEASDAASTLKERFGVASLGGFGLEEGTTAVAAAGAILRYVAEMSAADHDSADADPRRLAHLEPPRVEREGERLEIDAIALRALEVERTVRSGGSEGTLVEIMQRARTPMGRRLLREWLCYPLANLEAIRARHRRVAILVDDRRLAERLRGLFDRIQDLARIGGRLGLRRATPRDLAALAKSVEAAGMLAAELRGVEAFAKETARLDAAIERLAPACRETTAAIEESPPPHLREGGAIRDGFDAELDEARSLHRDGHGWLSSYQASLAAQTGIASLKIGFNRVFGYYVEITHAHRDAAIPAEFVRRQTLKNAERYTTPELSAYESKALDAESRALDRERQIFEQLISRWVESLASLAEVARMVAGLDVIAGFAEIAAVGAWVEPEMIDAPVLAIEQGRHPVLDRLLRDRFVPNDCRLGIATDEDPSGAATLALITGPNMAGKSTFIRQAALLVLLAHAGSFVPADRATIGLCDRIFTRIGASDELHGGQSTFMVEMTETANLLRHATRRSLVVLDEIGRGTSTLDGLALAWAIAETLGDRGCRTLLATHYHELTRLGERHGAVRNLNVAVREWGDRIVFLHRIEPGRADRSYGLHVARLAGVPDGTVERAEAVLGSLEVRSGEADPPPREAAPPSRRKREARDEAPSLFDPATHPVVEALKAIEVERLTPLEAFDLVRRLREQVD